MVITTWKVGSQVDLAAFRVFKKYLRILLYYGGNFPSGSTAQWNGIADCYIFPHNGTSSNLVMYVFM